MSGKNTKKYKPVIETEKKFDRQLFVEEMQKRGHVLTDFGWSLVGTKKQIDADFEASILAATSIVPKSGNSQMGKKEDKT